MIRLFTFILILFAWHWIFISHVGDRLRTGTFNDSYKGLPGYELISSVNDISKGNVCEINPLTNEITLCKLGSSICMSKAGPPEMGFVDPYNFIKPLTIKVCL
ncbi:hypothetical protein QKU48_gp0098 [Fadolivirus algeromassiliense]|jgi:hypothetical protein|uniref:Uncharacterized protein n=1 Tax=Fadolivirus FV1/VV64 TaxID=3070911 RepID=A0A7D3V7A0_9VIRU|nr:hypothetical protein QKU48_gp0098 [Fadolivirus algeromassiliense]QKF93556.1 hypothetical protein Fadolivirus_1_98 [Fadolivirus FV1/VV64]